MFLENTVKGDFIKAFDFTFLQATVTSFLFASFYNNYNFLLFFIIVVVVVIFIFQLIIYPGISMYIVVLHQKL